MSHRPGLGTRYNLMATEAIKHQGRSPLFLEICALVTKVRAMPQATLKPGTFNTLGIGDLVLRLTGINTSLKIADDWSVNAWIYPPAIDANHALLDDLRRDSGFMMEHIAKENAQTFGQQKYLIGTVDLDKSRVTGDFSKIHCPMEVTKGLLLHADATPEMITSAILHEIGHAFTYFEHYGRMTTFNGALHAAAERFVGADSREDKIKIINDIDGSFQTHTHDMDATLAIKSKQDFIVTYARIYLLERKSQLGSSMYDVTLWESLADQFAMRHGSGADSIKLDALLNRSVFNTSYQSWITHIIMTLLKSLLFFTMLFFGAFGVLMILFINPSIRIYDEPRARMDRMRRDMVAGLKDPTLPKAAKAQIVQDLELSDEILAQFNDKRGLIELFYTSILPNGRRQVSQRAFQLQMEQLTTSELFVAAGKLGTLITKK